MATERAQCLMQARMFDYTLDRIGRVMRAQKRAQEVPMDDDRDTYIAMAIAALEQKADIIRELIPWLPPGPVLENQVLEVADIDAAIALLHTMDHTMWIQVDRIVELQRQLMKAEAAACRKA